MTKPPSLRLFANVANVAPNTANDLSPSSTSTTTDPGAADSNSLIAFRPSSMAEALSSRTARIVIAGPCSRAPDNNRISALMCARRPVIRSVASATSELEYPIDCACNALAMRIRTAIGFTAFRLSRRANLETWRGRSDGLPHQAIERVPLWVCAPPPPGVPKTARRSRAQHSMCQHHS
jgi:hypothetical protein